MTTQIQFKSFDFKHLPVRIIIDGTNEFWFCGSDVCDILGYTNSRKALQDHCKVRGVTKRYTPTVSGEQEMIFINEPNLYRLIIKSRKPEAEPFEAWVFEEVLPQIRKTGQYANPERSAYNQYQLEHLAMNSLTPQEIDDFVRMYFAFTRQQESVYHLTQELSAFRSRHLDSVHFNYDVCQRYIKLCAPMIQKIQKRRPQRQLALRDF